MKTRIYTLLSIVLLPFVLFSCSRTLQPEIPASDDLITIQATIPGGQVTKVVAADASSGLDWNWEAGDQLAVVSGEVSSVFSIRSGFEPKKASFTGRQINGEKYTIIYPGNYLSVDELKNFPLTDQMQKGNDSKEHLKYFAVLEDISDYKSFAFSPESGSLKQCGVIKFTLTLPGETTVVNRISLRADSPIFHSGNADDILTDALSIGLSDVVLGEDKTVVAWMNTSWFDDAIPAGTPLTVNVTAGELNWVADYTPAVDKTVKSGFVNKVTVADASKWVTGGRYADGEGTEENPWLIKTPTQLCSMRDDLESKELRYFKLIADIDLEGIEWLPLNNVNNEEDASLAYDKFVHFDGDGHTIFNLTITQPVAYPSFAGVLYGTVKNVTFKNANIAAGDNKAGVVAGYVGTTQAFCPSEISNVTVQNVTISSSRHVGAFVGQVVTENSSFTDCHVVGATVNGAEYSGGFAGYIQNGTFTRCSSDAVVSGTKHVGGFVGKTELPTLTDCAYEGASVSASASGNNQSGGFVGNAGKSNNMGGTFVNCYVKGSALNMPSAQRVGGFVGQADLGNTFTKCYVKDVTITCGQNGAGFVGVDYATTSEQVPGGGIYQCWVDGGSLKAGGANCGGFAGYPEGALMLNCYSSMDVDGGANAAIGGFIGICKNNVTARYCYSSGTVTGTKGPLGLFVGQVDKVSSPKETHINYCIGWGTGLEFAGKVDTGADVSNNYSGNEGTISAHALELGWDPDIWDFSAKLK